MGTDVKILQKPRPKKNMKMKNDVPLPDCRCILRPVYNSFAFKGKRRTTQPPGEAWWGTKLPVSEDYLRLEKSWNGLHKALKKRMKWAKVGQKHRIDFFSVGFFKGLLFRIFG